MGFSDFLEKAGVIEKTKKTEEVVTTKQEPVKETKVISGKITSDPELKDHLFKSFEKSKSTNEIDYLDFKKTVSKVNSNLSIVDKFQAIFSTLSVTANLTKESLLKSIDKYIELVKEEKNDFAKEIENQIESKVKGTDNKINDIQQEIINSQKEIERLSQVVTQNQTMINELQNEKQVIQKTIEQTNIKFQLTIDEVMLELETDKNNINTYIS